MPLLFVFTQPLSLPPSASILLSLLPFIPSVVHLLLSGHVVRISTVLSGCFPLKIKWRNLGFDKLSPNIPLSSCSGYLFSSKYTLASISGYLCSLLSPWVVNGNKSHNFCVLVKVTPTTIAEASSNVSVLPQVKFTTRLQKALGDCAWWVALFDVVIRGLGLFHIREISSRTSTSKEEEVRQNTNCWTPLAYKWQFPFPFGWLFPWPI